MDLQKELLITIKDELQLLLVDHYEELTLNKHQVKLNPDWDRYFELERQGKLHLFTLRDQTELVGYSVFFLDTHIHYKDLMVATNDIIYLKKSDRLGISGIRLIKYSEQQMKLLGADKITWHVKLSQDFRPILHRMGYMDEDIIVGKILT
jgi:hypothetical protein